MDEGVVVVVVGVFGDWLGDFVVEVGVVVVGVSVGVGVFMVEFGDGDNGDINDVDDVDDGMDRFGDPSPTLFLL